MIKIVPPDGFRPPFSIDESRFSFKCRLQTLTELDIKNRSRLFFWKQLNNFKRSRRNGQLLLYPFDQRSGLFYYDIYIFVLKYYSGDKEDADLGERRSRKRKRHEAPARPAHRTVMMDPARLVEDDRLWNELAKELSSGGDVCKSLFRTHILPYYKFLYSESLRWKSESFIAGLLHKHEFPKSLLEKDSDDESSHTDQTLFSDATDYDDDELESDEDDDKCPICSKFVSNAPSTSTCSSCGSKFHHHCIAALSRPTKEWVCNTCIVGNGYYGFKEPSSVFTLKSFKEDCGKFDAQHFPGGKPTDIEVLEKLFWNNVENISASPLTVKYGADIHNARPGEMTGFPTMDFIPGPFSETDSDKYKEFIKYTSHPWNLMNLPAAKGSLLSIINRKISGMTIPWLYVGSTFSTFCWHLEDQYTLSANYQHEGASKVWYAIPESSSAKFNSMMKDIAPDLFERQPDLLHQLITLISPYSAKFMKSNIKCYKAVQNPGEFIITYPKCYHAGFNTGFNFNEAVNFTLDLWLQYGLESITDYQSTKRTAVVNLFDLMLSLIHI